MFDIITLLDLLNTADGDAWRDAFDALLDAGYGWIYTGADERFRLTDLLVYYGF